MKYVVVDVETTGGKPNDGGIIEIGMVQLDDVQVVKTYHSFIDPGMPIQPFVKHLTGITDEMIEGKPSFAKLAEDIRSFLGDRIFVAHNVQFDSRFIITEFKRCSIKYDPPRLCTVKLSRKAFPGFPSYSLRNLTLSLGLSDFNHHRALDDSLAAAEILKLSIKKMGEDFVLKQTKNLKRNNNV